MKTYVIPAIAALMLSGMASAEEAAPKKAIVPLTQEQMEAAKKVVADTLKDPESARFSDLYAIAGENAKPGEYAVCGRVNAKNSYGGYVGYRPFLVMDTHVVIAGDARAAMAKFDNDLIKSICEVSQ
jgi:hypothetical protein